MKKKESLIEEPKEIWYFVVIGPDKTVSGYEISSTRLYDILEKGWTYEYHGNRLDEIERCSMSKAKSNMKIELNCAKEGSFAILLKDISKEEKDFVIGKEYNSHEIIFWLKKRNPEYFI